MFDSLFKILKSFLLIELLEGLLVTLKHFLGDGITIYFPDEKIPKSDRFKGTHALIRYNSKIERCIGCKLCEIICPSKAITIKIGIIKKKKRITLDYEVDLFKCIYCGYCEESCPVNSIVLTDLNDFIFYEKSKKKLNKVELLNLGDNFIKRKIEDNK